MRGRAWDALGGASGRSLGRAQGRGLSPSGRRPSNGGGWRPQGWKRLGELLAGAGWLREQDLENALEVQQRQGGLLGRILLEKRVLTERTLLDALSRQLGLEVVAVAEAVPEPDALSVLPYAVAKKYRAIPLRREERVLHVAMSDPQNVEVLQALSFATGMRIEANLCSETEIDIAVEQHYGMEDALAAMVRSVTRKARLEGPDPQSLLEIEGPEAGERRSDRGNSPEEAMAPIVRLVNLIFLEAIRKRASDIHVECGRQGLQVRFRQDGLLHPRMNIPKYLERPVISRIKVMARMDIANRRVPQDGGIRLTVENRRFDLRVSSLPTFHGEKIVIRLLEQGGREIDLTSLGLVRSDLARLETCFRRPQGMLLVTGPTGSGKSTTLHCILKEIRSQGINIVTVEDPVEYELEGVNQVQVNQEAGLAFADSLRAILRQDPNVIMVGEIRDTETAEVAFRASMTGHLVLSTLHTNDAVSTVTRLKDMGVPDFLIGSALLAVVSQRLVRRVCTGCRSWQAPERRFFHLFSCERPPPGRVAVGRGCSQCEFTGYHGRVGLFELMVVSEEVREHIARGSGEAQTRKAALKQGMRTLFEDGLDKVRQGVTTLDEVVSAACSVSLAGKMGAFHV